MARSGPAQLQWAPFDDGSQSKGAEQGPRDGPPWSDPSLVGGMICGTEPGFRSIFPEKRRCTPEVQGDQDKRQGALTLARWDDERRRYLSMFTTIGVGFALYYFAQALFTAAKGLAAVHAVIVLCMVVAKVLSRPPRDTRWGTTMFLFTLNNFVFFSSVFDGLIEAPGLWSIALLPMATAFLWDLRATIVASVVALLDVLVLAWMGKNYAFAREFDAGPDLVLIMMMFTISLFSLFSFLSTSASHRKLCTLESKKKQLDQANQESMHAFEEKQVFLAKMSHEIRTPMNGLLGCVRELQSVAKGDERLRSIAASTQQDAENLLVALDACLDTSQSVELSQAAGHIQAHPVDLESSLRRASAKLGRLERWADVGAQIELGPEYRWCELDEGRVHQLLLNLAAAMPASHLCAEPKLCARIAAQKDSARAWIELELGGPYPKVVASDQLISGSSGLELLRTSLDRDCVSLAQAVSLQLIHEMGAVPLMHGDNPELMVGARIPFVGAVHAMQRSEPRSQQAQAPLVLVADDNAINVKVASLMLQRCGCQVEVAVNGVQAVDASRARRFDLVLMDVRMPEMDGLEATRRIVASCPFNAKTPIVALTANAFESDRRACLAAGMVEHLAKPLKPEALSRVLAKYIQPQPAQEERRCG